ncbi:unnamed protein product [Discula destructiva]
MEPSDPSQAAPPVDIHSPFTRAERMGRLAEIDQDIVSLLSLSGKAIQSLGHQPQTANRTEPTPQASDEQTQTFQDTMDKFLTTLHKIDVRMKREIFALEEAGIVTIDKVKSKDDEDPADQQVSKASLEPNGMGMVGNLDVGWLNSRSNQVEREMEAELWTNTRKALENLARDAGAGAGAGADLGASGNGADVNMTGSEA